MFTKTKILELKNMILEIRKSVDGLTAAYAHEPKRKLVNCKMGEERNKINIEIK